MNTYTVHGLHVCVVRVDPGSDWQAGESREGRSVAVADSQAGPRAPLP